MGKIITALLCAIVGGAAASLVVVAWLGWGVPVRGQVAHLDPTRGDYVDLLLTLATIFLGAIGLAVTVGALVIGFVALKTMREIKDEAAGSARDAAGRTINETMATELEPNVNAKLQEVLPSALRAALVSEELGHAIFSEMAKRGELDIVLERVAMRMQSGGPDMDEDPFSDEKVSE